MDGKAIMSIREVHERELERFRSSMNLVGPGVISFHFEDCEKGLAGLELAGCWADLGSGAGFPGLVMAHLFPHLQIHLVESRQKRASFLRHVVMSARIEHATVLHQRAQALPPHRYDGVVSRAFASPSEVLRQATELLSTKSGQVIMFLQGDADWQLPDEWDVLASNEYVVHGKHRRTVLMARS